MLVLLLLIKKLLEIQFADRMKQQLNVLEQQLEDCCNRPLSCNKNNKGQPICISINQSLLDYLHSEDGKGFKNYEDLRVADKYALSLKDWSSLKAAGLKLDVNMNSTAIEVLEQISLKELKLH